MRRHGPTPASWIGTLLSTIALVTTPACGGGGGSSDDGETADEAGSDAGESQGSEGSETGETDTEGTAADVTIFRDAFGVPHIRGGSDAAAFFGLGYATAEDRLLQMNLGVLTAQGRLAEFFGSDYVEADRQMRVMGMWRHAEKVAQNLDPEYLELLQAYADGVNHYLEQNPDAPSAVMTDLGVPALQWTPAHSLAAWYRVAAFFSPGPLDKAQGYYEFEDLEAQVGTEAAIDQTIGNQHPGDPSKGVVQAADVPQDVQNAIADYAASMGYPTMDPTTKPLGFADVHPMSHDHFSPKFSHAWVVGGDRTTTGKAALVSDPQLPIAWPNLLYEWQISSPTIEARGTGVPGSPGLLIGYTDAVAWGMTAAALDQADLFVLQMTGETEYTVEGDAYDITSEDETIVVKDGSDVAVSYRESIWGPVVTDLIDVERDGEFAMKAIPYAEEDRDTFVGMVEMMRAKNIAELRNAIEDWRYPSANFVAGDGNGNIFYTVVGAIPVRSVDSPLGGMIAQEGGDLVYDWQDIMPNEVKPWVENPAAGFLLSANHRIVGDWYPMPLGVGAGAGGDTIRASRLRELLEALPQLATPTEVLDQVQWDCTNRARRDLVAVGAHIANIDQSRLSGDTLQLLAAMDGWTGDASTESDVAFLAWQISTKFRVQQTGPVLNDLFGGGETGMNLFLDTLTDAIEEDPSYLPSAEAIAYIDTTLGDAWLTARNIAGDQATWPQKYEDNVATKTLEFLVGPDLGPVGSGESATYTVTCPDGQTIWSQLGETYTQHVDLADPSLATSVLPPGNPEGPNGSLWDAQADLWQAGSFKPAVLGADAVDGVAVTEVELSYDP